MAARRKTVRKSELCWPIVGVNGPVNPFACRSILEQAADRLRSRKTELNRSSSLLNDAVLEHCFQQSLIFGIGFENEFIVGKTYSFDVHRHRCERHAVCLVKKPNSKSSRVVL